MALAGYPAAWALHGALATVLDSLDRAAAAAVDFGHALERQPDDRRAAERQRRAHVALDLARNADATGAPRGLVVRGPFRDTSGYSLTVRRFLLGLRDRGLALRVAGTLWGRSWTPAAAIPGSTIWALW